MGIDGKGARVVGNRGRCRSFQEPEQFDGERQHQGGVLLGRDLDDGFQEPQLQGGRVFGHDLGGLGEFLGCLKFAVGGDDSGSSFTLGFGLAGHGALHRIGQHHVLDFDAIDVYAPAQRGTVEHHRQALVEAFTVGEQVIEVALADDRAQRGLRDLADRGHVVLDVDGDPYRIAHVEVDDGVDPDGDVVAGDAVLGGHGHRDDLHAHLLQAISQRHQQHESGSAHTVLYPAEPEDDAALELFDDPEAGCQDKQTNGDQGTQCVQDEHDSLHFRPGVGWRCSRPTRVAHVVNCRASS